MAGPRKVQIGQEMTSFPGRSFNELVTQWYRTQAKFGRNNKGSSGPGQILVVKAKNETGETLEYGHCVAIEEAAISVADKPKQVYRRPLLKANKPTSALKHSILGVSLKTLPDGKPGPFITEGVAWLRCNVTNEDHGFVNLKPNQTTFVPEAESGTSGHRILDKETGTGVKWAVVMLGAAGSSNIIRGYLMEDVQANDIILTGFFVHRWDPLTNTQIADDAYDQVDGIGVINWTNQLIQGETNGGIFIPLEGTLNRVNSGVDNILVPAIEVFYYDHASLEGHRHTTVDNLPQGPSHDGDFNSRYKANGTSCNTVTPEP